MGADQYGIAEENGADTLYVAKKGMAGSEKLIRIPAPRFERHRPDKIFVIGDRIVILVSCGSGVYVHYFLRTTDGRYQFERWPSGPSEDFVGSDNVLKLGGNLLGCVWISPDFSAEVAGNYLYVYSPTQLKFGRLPGEDQGYEIHRGTGAGEFQLARWRVNDGEVGRSTHKLPFWMKDGVWLLDFPR